MAIGNKKQDIGYQPVPDSREPLPAQQITHQFYHTKGGPINPSTTTVGASTHQNYINDNIIWSSFPLSERVLVKMKNSMICQKRLTFVDELLKVDPKYKANPPVNMQLLTEKIAEFQIIESSHLEMDPNVIHPFVKIHIVDIKTGAYLKKSMLNPAVSLYEKLTKISQKSEPVEEGITI